MTSRKLLLRIGVSLVTVCLLIAAVGAAYNALSIRHFRKVAGVPGKLYDIDGHAMHMYCTGKGSPTIVLSAGLGDDFLGWAKVQPDLSRLTRVCSYDRAGMGWSDYRPEVQDANAVIGQLHALLDAAAIERPFVLMGHSISGMYLRSYASRYPNELAGMVFVDGSTPLQDERVPKEILALQDEQRSQMPWQTLLMRLGWYRLKGDCTAIPPGLDAYAAWIKADSCIPSQMDAVANELDAVHATGEETVHAGPFGALPILILSHDPTTLPPNWPAPVAKAMAVVWASMQEEAKGLSSHSRRVIAKGSDHYIQNDRPELVVREVTLFIETIRGHKAFPETQPTVEE